MFTFSGLGIYQLHVKVKSGNVGYIQFTHWPPQVNLVALYQALIIQVYLIAMRNFHKVCLSCSGVQNNYLEKRKFVISGLKGCSPNFSLSARQKCENISRKRKFST